MSKSNDFPVFLADYGPSFARTAYLLTGDADQARDLAVSALVTVGRRWASARWSQPAHTVLRELYRRFLSDKTSPVSGSFPLASLPPNVRAAVVARYHDGLPPEQAAAITGLWTAILDQETDQALAHLKATHPHLFAGAAAPQPAEAPGRAGEPRQDPEAASPATPAPAPWAAPEAASPAAHEATPWTAPEAASPATPGAPHDRPGAAVDGHGAVDPPGTGPWAVPARAWDAGAAEDDEPAVRSALIRIAGEMPHIHLADAVLRVIGMRRRIRAATWTTLVTGSVAAFAVLTMAAVTAVARNIEQVIAEPGGYPSSYQTPEKTPDAIPAQLSDPIHYASQGYCGNTPNEPANPQPCGQWRLTTVSGAEWRLPGAGAGYDEDTGVVLPLAISPNGRRLAYRDNQGSYVVQDLPTGTLRRIDVDDEQLAATITSSPNGRYFALAFDGEGTTTSALLDFDTGVTRYTTGKEVEVLAVRDDGAQVISERENVDNVPGHAAVTTIELRGAQVYAGGYRIDPDLVAYGGALSPDGQTLALVSEGTHLVTMDVRTGRVSSVRAELDDYEVIAVERWISADEVLVRQWDDDYAFLTKVNVRSGTSTELGSAVSEWLDYDSPIGALQE
ncbi:hypothetical protein ETD86_44980 [Nonomuraea turkmeniaca]|uniref:WD40 repeat domain-containing protein n=1 Tax=Nonomuraea turkmeniaca TaxID=103838 RepID=A0A5S4EZ94_9ACTN|nr:hypothetical protein [Nonomuraea turkmeniaca]TMR09089.1 hypothetical protein ETD86_44980 [Nonomuraea turkmeniaca]